MTERRSASFNNTMIAQKQALRDEIERMTAEFERRRAVTKVEPGRTRKTRFEDFKLPGSPPGGKP